MTWVAVETLSTADIPAVLALVDDAYGRDGVPPLSDQAVLQLRYGAPGVSHLVARATTGSVVGYLQQVDESDATVGELVVAPAARRRGVGTALADAALAGAAPDRVFRAWAHGNSPAAAALAASLGFRDARVLLQMGRAADVSLPEARVPAGVRIRTFRPGADDEAWVRVNSRAFAHHPEQGRLGVADLRERMSEPWFDPAGFFVAEREKTARVAEREKTARVAEREKTARVAERESAGALVGFHWTKVHDRPAPVGEVYAVGVDPTEQGSGLGLALTVTGLAHLVSLGLPQLMLYADESNAGAVRMYERLGFAVTATDVMYER